MPGRDPFVPPIELSLVSDRRLTELSNFSGPVAVLTRLSINVQPPQTELLEKTTGRIQDGRE